MATVDPRTAGTQQKYVDFDEYVEYQLAKTRHHLKATELFTTGTRIAVFALLYVLLFVVLDHWVIPGGFSVNARIALLTIWLVVTGGWLIWRVLLPSLRSINALFAARTIEHADPQFKSSLLNLVDLRQSANKPVPDAVLRAMEKRAALALTQVDVDQAIDRRPLMRTAYALLAVVAVACAYVLFSPKDVVSSVKRLMLPVSATAAPTQTQISNVVPGDKEVLARTLLTVEADILGSIPEQVTLLYTTTDRKFVDEPIEMRRVQEGLPRYRAVITGDNGRGLLQDLTYSIRAGDAQTRDYRITVLQPPSGKVDRVEYEYPAYMKFSPRTQTGGHIDGWEGTTVTVHATTNMPVKAAVLVLTDSEDPHARGEEVRVKIEEGRRLTAEWKLQFRPDGTYARYYRIDCTAESGESDPEPTHYTVKIQPDARPDVQLIHPVQDLERPANAVVPMLVRAQDPDFMLRFLRLRVEKDGQEVHTAGIFEGEQPSFEGSFDFDLKDVRVDDPAAPGARRGLKAGDELQFWIEARDNKQPFSNRTNTQRLKIIVKDPASREALDEQLAEDRQEQQAEREKLQQAENEKNPRQEPADEPMADADAPMDPMDPRYPRREPPPMPDEGEPSPEERQQNPRDQQEGAQGQQRQQQKGRGTEQGAKGEGQQGQGQQGKGKSGRERGNPQEGEQGSGEGDSQQRPGQSSRKPADDQEALQKLLDRQRRQQQQQREQGAQDKPGEKPDAGEQKSQPGMNDSQKPDADRGDAPPMPGETGGKEPAPKDADPNAKPGESSPENNGQQKPSQDQSRGDKGGDPSQRPRDDGKPAGDQPQKPSNTPREGEKPKPGEQAGNEKSQDGDKGSGTEKSTDGNGDGSDGDPMAKEDATGDAGKNSQMAKSPPQSQRPGEADSGPKQPRGGEKGQRSDSVPDGEKRPAADSPDAEQRKADGTERGEGTAEKNPDGTEPRAKDPNQVRRKPGTESAPDPNSARRAENQDPQPADGTDADPTQTKPGEMQRPNPDQGERTPGEGKTDNPRQRRPGDEPATRDDEMKGPGRPDQKSDKPDTGEGGGSTPQSQGDKGSDQQGAGDQRPEPGQGNKSGKPGGDSSNQKGPGERTQSAERGEGQPNGKPGQQADSQKDAGKPGSGDSGEPGQKGGRPGQSDNQKTPGAANEGERQPGQEGSGTGSAIGDDAPAGNRPPDAGRNGGARDGNAHGTGGEGSSSESPEEANLDYAREASNLVLRQLKDDLERGEVDEDLLKELGWTKDQLERFTKRLENRLKDPGDDQSPESIARRRQFEAMLESLNLNSDTVSRKGRTDKASRVGEIDAQRAPVPPEYKELFEAYTRGLSRETAPPRGNTGGK